MNAELLAWCEAMSEWAQHVYAKLAYISDVLAEAAHTTAVLGEVLPSMTLSAPPQFPVGATE